MTIAYEYLNPPDFPDDALDTLTGLSIAADWWEERGFLRQAKALRGILKSYPAAPGQLCDDGPPDIHPPGILLPPGFTVQGYNINFQEQIIDMKIHYDRWPV